MMRFSSARPRRRMGLKRALAIERHKAGNGAS
jgi:hypothetical protein